MTDSTKKPEFREDDSWFSEAQLDRLAPADHADLVHSPIPTQMVSNGEYMPIGQTDKQKEVEARLAALSAQAAKRLGMSRRKFLATTGGFAASFIAMNQVFGEFFDVRPIEMLMSEAYAAGGPPRDLFVFDDQTHIIRSSRTGPGNALRDIAEGNPNTFNVGSTAGTLPPTPGIVDNVKGPLVIVGSGGDTMNVDDTGSTAQKSGTLAPTTIMAKKLQDAGFFSGKIDGELRDTTIAAINAYINRKR